MNVAVGGFLGLLCGTVYAGAGAVTAPDKPAAAAQPAASPSVTSGSPARRPLTEIVKALEIEHGIALMDPWGVIEGADAPAVLLGSQSPEAAFRALLGEHELLFYYPAAGVPGSGRLAEVWVYPRGMLDRRAMGALSGEGTALAGDGASRRAAMIENAVLRDPATAQEAVFRGLGDVSENVRASTLAVATSMGVPIPRETLLEMMRSDPAEVVRSAAVDALAMSAVGDPDLLREIVQQAELDPSPVMRAKAAELAVMHAPPDDMLAPEPVPDVMESPLNPHTGSPLQPGILSPPLQ